MLLSDEVAALVLAFTKEAKSRREIAALLPADLVGDDNFWAMLFDHMQNVAHRNGVVLVRQSDFKGVERRRIVSSETEE
jgi:hypothetical protein